jgi:hypothetical protein
VVSVLLTAFVSAAAWASQVHEWRVVVMTVVPVEISVLGSIVAAYSRQRRGINPDIANLVATGIVWLGGCAAAVLAVLSLATACIPCLVAIAALVAPLVAGRREISRGRVLVGAGCQLLVLLVILGGTLWRPWSSDSADWYVALALVSVLIAALGTSVLLARRSGTLRR